MFLSSFFIQMYSRFSLDRPIQLVKTLYSWGVLADPEFPSTAEYRLGPRCNSGLLLLMRVDQNSTFHTGRNLRKINNASLNLFILLTPDFSFAVNSAFRDSEMDCFFL